MKKITFEEREGKTPSGGSRSEIRYYDDNMQPVDKDSASKCIVKEFDDKGKLLNETMLKRKTEKTSN